MRKTGTINIANNINQVEFSLLIKTGNLEDPVLTWLSECQNKLASVLEIPAIKIRTVSLHLGLSVHLSLRLLSNQLS